jgi:hypothetical protein
LEYDRVEATQFFSARSTGLVGSENDVILDCYQLARFYHVSPEVFLNMPLSEVLLHLVRSNEMAARQRQQISDDDE